MPLDAAEMRRIARSWIELQGLPEESPRREAEFWSHERFWELTRDDPESAWTIIDMIRRDASDRVLANLAAGPLEDLLVAHGERFIERFEALAARDPDFRQLLGATWQNSMSPELWKRIKAVAAPSW